MEEIKQIVEKILIDRKMKKSVFLSKIGMSASGYWEMYENKSMKVSTLLKISEVLNTPIITFFSEPIRMVDPAIFDKSNKERENYIDLLLKQNEAMQKQVTDLIKMQLINSESILNLTQIKTQKQ